jgi:hypothetical protein
MIKMVHLIIQWNLSKPNHLGTSLCVQKTGVWFIQVKITKIFYIKTVSQVRFIHGSGLLRVLVYWWFWFIEGSGLFTVLVYWGLWFIDGSGLLRVLVYWRFWFIEGSGLFTVLVYWGFWFIEGSGLFTVLVYWGFWFIEGSAYTGLTVHIIINRLYKTHCITGST